MPLNRTPPTTHSVPQISNVNKVSAAVANVCPSEVGIQHYYSAPDLRSMMENITERKKRKFEESDSCDADVIKEMFMVFAQDQTARFEELQSTINSLKEQNNKLTQSVELMSNKYDEFLHRISQLESERREEKKY